MKSSSWRRWWQTSRRPNRSEAHPRLASLRVGLRLTRLEDRTVPASFQGLGFLPGDNFSSAAGVSADGSVVVGSSSDNLSSRAFRWTAAGGMVDLGTLPGAAGGQANDCSADGSVIVGSTSSTGYGQAWRWTAASGMVAIPNVPDQVQSNATGVSADGSVVVGSSTNGIIPGPHRAWRWTAAGGTVDLGFLPGGWEYAGASSVSADGSVIVGTTYTGSEQDFRWTAATGMVGLQGGGGASRVSPDGTIIVGGGGQAYRWTAAGGFVNLTFLPGDYSGGAFDLSANGSVIVGTSGNGSVYRAMIWTEAQGMRDLRSVLINDYGLGAQLAGWTLRSATACSDDGHVIVGYGIGPDGNQHGWIAQIDPPPHVAATQVNDGSLQRSRVTSLTIRFDSQVTFTGTVASAFTLTRNGGGAVSFAANATVVNGVTIVTLSNFTGNETQFSSLRDGRYTLTALSSQISGPGGALDGDGDGQAGGNYTFGDAQGLYRYFGDVNADRHVDIADFGLMSITYGLHAGQTGFVWYLDFNGDGTIDILDFGQFSIRMFTMLP
jgi:probable HAF family extracellular repeat protein